MSRIYFTLHFGTGHFIWEVGVDLDKGGMNTDGRNVNNLKYADNTTLLAENSEVE